MLCMIAGLIASDKPVASAKPGSGYQRIQLKQATPVPTPVAPSANGAASAPAKKQEVVEIHQRNS